MNRALLSAALLALATGPAQTRAQSIYTPYTFTNFAGVPGVSGSNDGPGSGARFGAPFAVAVDAGGTLYVADSGNNTIRKITPDGVVTTLAGCATCPPGSADGIGSEARFYAPQGIAAYGLGNVIVADTYNHTIRKITADCPKGERVTSQHLTV
jgi:DNA-binding beta-propeller fold protein YncE